MSMTLTKRGLKRKKGTGICLFSSVEKWDLSHWDLETKIGNETEIWAKASREITAHFSTPHSHSKNSFSPCYSTLYTAVYQLKVDGTSFQVF